MALIRFAEGQQRSGSIGATVYSHNRFGAYVRARSVPVNPNTERQVAARNRARALAIAWQEELTDAEREAWDIYGAATPWLNKLGQVVELPGLNHYIRSNTARLMVGLARQDAAPPLLGLPPAELSLAVTGSEATGLLSVAFDDTAPWCSEDDAFQMVFQGIPQKPSRTFFNGPWRYAAAIAGDSGTPITSPQTMAASFPLVETQKIWVRTRILRADGRLSEFALDTFLAGA